jgi:hypothetical protein
MLVRVHHGALCAEPTGLADEFSAEDISALLGVVQAASNAETFISRPLASRHQCLEALQSVYRLASDGFRAHRETQKLERTAQIPPGKLVTDNFHVEQIWGQIDVFAEAAMKRVRCDLLSSAAARFSHTYSDCKARHLC